VRPLHRTDQAAQPKPGGGRCGRLSGPPGPGPCPGGWPPALVSVSVGESLAACWRPGPAWRLARWWPWRPAGAAVPAQPGRRCLAAGGGRGAAHCPAPWPAGAARVGHPAGPGRPRQPANIDHLAIGPGGVFVIDSKRSSCWAGSLDPSGWRPNQSRPPRSWASAGGCRWLSGWLGRGWPPGQAGRWLSWPGCWPMRGGGWTSWRPGIWRCGPALSYQALSVEQQRALRLLGLSLRRPLMRIS
jgi:hypothetical protein